MNFRRYIVVFLAVGVVILGAAVLINVAVDPYNVFGTTRVAGFNELKPFAGDRGRTAKVHQVLRARPATLIVGNSRPEMGLDPDHRCWSSADRPVFNLAVPGLTVYKQVRYAQHAMHAGTVRTIYLGVDFSDFLESRPRHDPRRWPAEEESVLRLAIDASGQPRRRYALERQVDRLRASLSLEALSDSLLTVMQQRRAQVETRTAAGFNPADGIYRPIVRTEGVRTLFTQKNREMASRLAPPQTLFNEGTNWSAEFEALDRLMAYTTERDVRLVLFINPYHAEYLLLLDSAGLWPKFEAWKTQLVRLAGSRDITTWDFSLFDEHAAEPVEGLAARGESLRWFWEPAHYREALGGKMLETLLPGCEGGFGVTLNPGNLDAVLGAIRSRRDRFVAAHLDIRERLEQRLAEARAAVRAE